MARKLDVLRRHCDEVGRDYEEITKTILYVAPALDRGDVDEFMSDMEHYAKLGVTEVGVMPMSMPADEWIPARCGAVIDRLRGL